MRPERKRRNTKNVHVFIHKLFPFSWEISIGNKKLAEANPNPQLQIHYTYIIITYPFSHLHNNVTQQFIVFKRKGTGGEESPKQGTKKKRPFQIFNLKIIYLSMHWNPLQTHNQITNKTAHTNRSRIKTTHTCFFHICFAFCLSLIITPLLLDDTGK